MPTITKKQYEAKKAVTPSGWAYDWKYAAIWGENRAVRQIMLDATHYVEAVAQFHGETRREQGPYCSYTVSTGKHVPTLTVSRWELGPDNRTAHSFGLGKSVPIGPAQDKKIYKALCKFAASVTDDDIMALLPDAIRAEGEPLFA